MALSLCEKFWRRFLLQLAFIVIEKNDLSGLELALVRLLFLVIIFVLLERTAEIKLFNIRLFIENFGRNILLEHPCFVSYIHQSKILKIVLTYADNEKCRRHKCPKHVIVWTQPARLHISVLLTLCSCQGSRHDQSWKTWKNDKQQTWKLRTGFDVSSTFNHKYKLSESYFSSWFLAHRTVLILLNTSF